MASLQHPLHRRYRVALTAAVDADLRIALVNESINQSVSLSLLTRAILTEWAIQHTSYLPPEEDQR